MMGGAWPWLILAALGAFHGLNPAMGWLFATALGLQRGRRGAVFAALVPIALGHACAIGLALAVVAVLRLAIDPAWLGRAAAVLLIGFGLFRLVRGYRHRVRVGMAADFSDLVLWSFLMATAHGAGLMMAPVLLALPQTGAYRVPPGGDPALHAHAHLLAGGGLGASLALGLLAVAVHTAAMLAVAGLIAWTVFDWIGLAVLRRGWVNLDLLWSLALILAGAGFLAADLAGL